MLILQIALGIVLAVVIFAFLPQILVAGIVGVGGAIAIAIAIAVLAGAYWLLSGLVHEAGGAENLIGNLVGIAIVLAVAIASVIVLARQRRPTNQANRFV